MKPKREVDISTNVSKLSGTIVVLGEKFITFEEFLPIFSQLKKEIKDQGCYEDFVECLKLYDKEENGKMLLGELHHSLVTLGIVVH